MSFLFHPEAEAEFLAAVDWYEERAAGLGGDFAAEIHAAIQRAHAMPLAWPMVDGEIRRVLANRFPYGVLFVPRGPSIHVLAVMHLRRHPDYWRDRS
ncbi:MAG: type II toxin-antitoxin system RelE/ParE family toxin [Sulfuritalea sp.]|nr:type II toxin-antitoxin system RelE/ParE family toxin [Sulfuritalea sp.]